MLQKVSELYTSEMEQTSTSSYHGAGQEQGRRAGTENVPYIVGLGRACGVALSNLLVFWPKSWILRDKLFRPSLKV